MGLLQCRRDIAAAQEAEAAAWLQAKRGSHIVITTIMFNFIASSLLVYLMVNHLRPAGAMSVESRPIARAGQLPSMREALAKARAT